MDELKRIIFEQSQRIKELEKYLDDDCKYKNKPLPPKVKNLIELYRRTKYFEHPFDKRIYFKQPSISVNIGSLIKRSTMMMKL